MIWNLLIVLSIAILAASLGPVRRLIAMVPNSLLRNYWRGLLGMIFLFIGGYLVYAILFWEHHLFNDVHDWVVPMIFFSGSAFVWFTSTLFLRTTQDLRRMALLEEENITDPLTGTYNRRYLSRRLANEIARSRRHGHALSALMIDIDHFKQVNDMHGHHAGDLALSYLGKLLLDAVRSADVVARYGGEEIVIIAPDSTENDAARLAERLREHVAEHELVLSSQGTRQKSVRLTISIGVAELTREIKTGNELIDCADKALYQAKKLGRNRMVPFSHLDT